MDYTGYFTLLDKDIKCAVIGKERLIIKADLFGFFNSIDNSGRMRGFLQYYVDKYSFNSEYTKYHALTDLCHDVIYGDEIELNKNLCQIIDVIYSGFQLVGLIPLIDEVTGYQAVRGDSELRDQFNSDLIF